MRFLRQPFSIRESGPKFYFCVHFRPIILHSLKVIIHGMLINMQPLSYKVYIKYVILHFVSIIGIVIYYCETLYKVG